METQLVYIVDDKKGGWWLRVPLPTNSYLVVETSAGMRTIGAPSIQKGEVSEFDKTHGKNGEIPTKVVEELLSAAKAINRADELLLQQPVRIKS